MNDIPVTIKFDSDKSCLVTVNSSTKISKIKQQACRNTNCSPSAINLIFAGQLLDDHLTVQDYNLVGQTTLHAFTVTGKSSSQHDSSATPSATTIQNQEDASSFFVYCKLCDFVNPGKLRVCCRLCGSSLFILNQGPSDWEDISPSTSIQGQCRSGQCQGAVPRFYMKCCHTHAVEKEGEEVTAVALKHIQANRKHVECIVCQDIISPVLIFPCPAGHVICLECFREYALTSLNSRQFIEHAEHGYTLPCPSGSCDDWHIEDNHHFCILGNQEYERYKNFGAEEFVLKNGGVLCPGPDCGMGMFPEDNDTRIQCTECQFVSCRHCHREFHYGSCDQSVDDAITSTQRLSIDGDRAERASWERQSLSLIGDIAKQCPNCNVKTQHSGGCMHMTCSRCHSDWCWQCVKPWDQSCEENHWFG